MDSVWLQKFKGSGEELGIKFYKAARLEPPVFKLPGFPAFEPHIFDMQGLLVDVTDDLN